MDNKQAYRSLCDQRKDIPVFLQHWWLDAVCTEWDVAIVKNGDSISGVWPYAMATRMGVSLFRNAKLTPYLGPHILYPADLKEANRDSYEYDTIADLLRQLPSTKVWNLSLPPGIKQAGIFKNYGLQVHVQQTFLIALHKEEAVLLSAMKESLRRNIRSAEKEYEITDDPGLLSLLYEYQKHTLTTKGVGQPYNIADMQKLMEACRQQGAASLWVAKKDNEVHALVWNVWDADTSYYFMGAQKTGSDSYRAMSALLWHAIKQARQRGNKTFDLEGSMDAGVERFFRNFAGQRELYLVLKKNDSLLWKLKGALS